MLGISWVAAQLAASQEGLSSMSEWVMCVYVLEVKNAEYGDWNFENDIFNLTLNKGFLTRDKGKTGKCCDCCQLKVINISIFSSGGTNKIWFTENIIILALVKDPRVKKIYFYDVELHENQNGPATFVRTSNNIFHKNPSSNSIVKTCVQTHREREPHPYEFSSCVSCKNTW
jgi:hypothetical protein